MWSLTKTKQEIAIPEDVAVFEDKRTNARSIALPFEFPNGKHGIVIMTRLTKMPWLPSNDIESITIHFKPNEY